MKLFKGILPVILAVILCNINSYGQEDIIRLREIINQESSGVKIDSLKNFKIKYAGSQYIGRADLELFNVYSDLGNADSAIHYAKLYSESLPASGKASAYNGIAFTLAENNIGLDTALAYADESIKLLQNNPRYINLVKDTKAYIFYKKGDIKSALELQKEALSGNEENPEFLYHYALMLQASGDTEEALKSAAKSALSGNPAAIPAFNKWKEAGKNYENIIMPVVKEYLANPEIENLFTAKSNAAAFLAQTGINTKLAEGWADSAYNSIDKRTGFEDYINLKKNYGIVKAALEKDKEALPALIDIEDLADPWLTDYWLTLGNIYRSMNEKEKAVDAYTSGLIAFEDSVLLASATSISTPENIEKIIEKKREEMTSPEAGKYSPGGKTSGKVVLAELFTGAECPPCVAADLAFDKLSEYYPRNALAILEYHLHIPGPDPLTNPDTYQRYLYYDADYGTPTVFFEGGEKIIGGGPKVAALNRYNVYNYSIKKFINDKPGAEITGNAKFNNGSIEINLSVIPNDDGQTKASLHIVLAEKSVDYTGANGISKHIFVVRGLVDGQQGSEVSLSEKSEIKKAVNLKELKDNISKYLADPTKDESWRQPQFTGWRSDTASLSIINEKNLAIVAWLQDPDTKEVLQAYYTDVQ
jgi:thiol-disulfide isomerase/thioredoxin